MSLNNYKLKNVPMGKIEIYPIYKLVIDIDDITFIKRNYEITELEAVNFLNPVSVLPHSESYILISGITTFMAYSGSGAQHVKARELTAASQQEKMLCVLYDIMSLTRLLPLSAKRRNLLKDQFYSYINKNPDAVKAFSLMTRELNSFSKILKHYDSSYRSAHFEHKKENRGRNQFKLSGKWFHYDADFICFDFNDGQLVGLSAIKNSFNQKIIFEQRRNNSYDAKADYLTNKHLFRFRIIPRTVYLANIEESLIYFDDTEKSAVEIVFGQLKIGNIRLEVKPRSRGYFITEQNTVKYLIDTTDSTFLIKPQNSHKSIKMKKYGVAVLPVE